jgi:hypothetical protein
MSQQAVELVRRAMDAWNREDVHREIEEVRDAGDDQVGSPDQVLGADRSKPDSHRHP